MNLTIDMSLPVGNIVGIEDDVYTGDEMKLQDSASTFVATTPATLVSENPGTRRGVWCFPAYDNHLITDPGLGIAWIQFAGWNLAGLTRTLNAGVGPDGDSNMTLLQDSTTLIAGSVSGVSVAGGYHTEQLWVKPYAGALPDQVTNTQGGGGPPYGFESRLLGPDWSYFTGGRAGNGGASLSLRPSSNSFYPLVAPPDPVGVGAVLAGWVQFSRQFPVLADEPKWFTHPPICMGQATARRLRLTTDAVAQLTPDGILDLLVCFDVSDFWGYERFFSLINTPGSYSYVWYAEDGGGNEYGVRFAYDGNFLIQLVVNNVVVLTKSTLDADRSCGGGRRKSEVTIRAIYDPVNGGAGSARMRFSYGGNFTHDAVGTAVGSPLPPMVKCDIGHKNGALYLPAIYNFVGTRFGFPATPVNASIFHLGDSTSAAFNRQYPRAMDFTMTFAEAHGDTGLRGALELAMSGHTVADQKAQWQSLTPVQMAGAQAVVLGPLGVTDIALGSDAPTVLAALQDLIDTIHADAPQAVILTFDILPCKTYLDNLGPGYNAVLVAVNAGIPALTGVTLFTPVHYYFDDGAGDMATRWQSEIVDYVHGNEFLRAELGSVFYRSALISTGILSAP